MKAQQEHKSIGVLLKKISREKIFLGIGMVAVFIAATWHLQDNYSLKVWGDEFGYWQSAAYFTGKDWSNIASTNAYYGYGYGILLAPIMLLFGHDPVAMLHAAMGMEAMMLASCVVAAYLCIGYFSEQIKGVMKVFLAVLPVLYPSNIMYVNTTLSEILLVTLVWWYTCLALGFIKEKGIGRAGVLVLISVYMYSVHQRTIAVMVVTLMLIVWVYRDRLLNPKLLVVMGIFFAGLFTAILVKRQYVAFMYVHVDEITYNVNNLAGQTSKMVRILTTFEGFWNFILSMIGKFYYASVASFQLTVFGLLYSGRVVYNCIKRKDNWNQMTAVAVIALNFIAAYLINAIYMSDGYNYRTDILIYGRYMDHMVGPLIILGVIYLYEYSNAKVILGVMSVSALTTVIASNVMVDKTVNSNIWVTASAIADMFQDSHYRMGAELYQALLRSFLFLFLFCLAVYFKKYFSNWGIQIVIICVCFVWISTGYKVWGNATIWANGVYRAQDEVLNYIDEDRFGLYQSYLGGFFQFLRVDDEIINFESIEDIFNEAKPMYIVSYVDAEDIAWIRKQEVIFENKRYVLWRLSVD